MLQLSGLHLLLTYQCTYECEHCFVWGSPWQSGVMKLADIQHILHEASRVPSVQWIYFEGGEPTLFQPLLVAGVCLAHAAGYHVGIVTNAFWATSREDALLWLQPLRGMVEDLSISSDCYHGDEQTATRARIAALAAKDCSLPVGTISIAPPSLSTNSSSEELSPLMYRGRAAQNLAPQAVKKPWNTFTACPYEDLQQPGRVHVDPFGHLHICQGISIGNLFSQPLIEICENFTPESHPIVGPLLENGPCGLVETYHLPHEESYADACHLCDEARHQLRPRFPQILTPDQMYAVTSA